MNRPDVMRLFAGTHLQPAECRGLRIWGNGLWYGPDVLAVRLADKRVLVDLRTPNRMSQQAQDTLHDAGWTLVDASMAQRYAAFEAPG